MKFRTRAAAIIFNDVNELLLVFHRSPITGEEWWTLPGGGIEGSENALETVVREVQEECGIICNPGKLVYVREFLGEFKDLHHIELFFTATADSYRITTGHDPEIEQQYIIESRFLDRTEIETTKINIYPEILRNQFWEDLKAGFIGHNVYLGQQ